MGVIRFLDVLFVLVGPALALRASVWVGHLYQGRYKSFPVQSNVYYLTLLRYVESNALKAGLVEKAGQWPWSSLSIRTGNNDKPITLCKSPVDLPKQWHRMVNNLATIDEGVMNQIERSIERGSPLGDDDWTRQMAGELGLESTIRPRGRPRKNNEAVILPALP